MNSHGDGTRTSDTQGLKHIDEEDRVTRFAEANPPWHQDAKPSWAQGCSILPKPFGGGGSKIVC